MVINVLLLASPPCFSQLHETAEVHQTSNDPRLGQADPQRTVLPSHKDPAHHPQRPEV